MLDIGNASGDFIPWVKYNAKAGRWYIKDDAGNDLEVEKPVFVADFANIKTGWFHFSAGNAPERELDPSLTERAIAPRDGFKRGFALNLFSNVHFGGVAELSSVANAICTPINELYGLYEAAPESKAGKLPVVAFVKTIADVGKHGTNFIPEFKIESWIDRPAELDAVLGTTLPAAASNGSATVAEVPAQAASGGSVF